MINLLPKARAFLSRWWTWLSAGLLFVALLSANRRAGIRLDRAKQNIREENIAEIEEGWVDIDEDVDEFLAANKKAKEVKENGQKQLDRIAKTGRSSSDIISDWNAANRLSDDQGVS